MRRMQSKISRVSSMREDELFEASKEFQVPFELIQFVHKNKKLPVVNFAAGGVAIPADATLMMQLGAEGVFVGSGIFKSGDPEKRAAAIVKAVTNYNDSALLADLSKNLGEAMVGIYNIHFVLYTLLIYHSDFQEITCRQFLTLSSPQYFFQEHL
ncbi:pyridoxal 5'-phosphate synthase, synthase subunit Pdx1 [Eubacterium ruminantium]|nr:pyridoxal 5'-phosphate synthase, synthase subunit Pdx1 [Eubacterium ruminantium]